jgi:hypothetical protein
VAIGSGLGSQVQFGTEVTYGTAVTPTVALEATSVGLELQVESIMSEGLRAGLRVQRGDRTVVKVDGILTGSFTVDGRDYIPSASAVTAVSYATGTEPLVFHQGAITVGGTAVPLKSYELSVTHGYDVERYQINSTSLKSRPIINAKDEITLTLEMDFDGTAGGATWATSDFVSKFRAGTKVTDIIGTWTGGTAIASTYFPYLKATVPQAVITSATPTIDGPEVVALTVELMATDDGTNQPLTLEYQSSENLS